MYEKGYLLPLFLTYDYKPPTRQATALLSLCVPRHLCVLLSGSTRSYHPTQLRLYTLIYLFIHHRSSTMLAILALAACANALPFLDIASTQRHTSQSKTRSLQVTSNVALLQRVPGDGLTSSKWLHEEVCPRGLTGTGYGQADLVSAELGQIFIANVSFGSQTFEAVVDTGSSDTWLVEAGFTCVNLTDNATLTEADCYFGSSGYTPDSTFTPIPDENFNISYADGEYLNGFLGYDVVTFSGITVQQQEVALGQYTRVCGCLFIANSRIQPALLPGKGMGYRQAWLAWPFLRSPLHLRAPTPQQTILPMMERLLETMKFIAAL